MPEQFLPVCPADIRARGWDQPDFVYVTGDAYVDHPSFGLAIISRVLEHAGSRVAMMPQPDFRSCEAFRLFGRDHNPALYSGNGVLLQGLIQIHRDYCLAAHPGCDSCRLVKALEADRRGRESKEDEKQS